MMRDVWTGRWALLIFVVAASTRLPAQAQEAILNSVPPTSALILLRPAAPRLSFLLLLNVSSGPQPCSRLSAPVVDELREFEGALTSFGMKV